mgnify:FL=1
MELQVNRLKEGMGTADAMSALEQRKRMEADWCCNGPVNRELVEPWLQRFQSAMSKLT